MLVVGNSGNNGNEVDVQPVEQIPVTTVPEAEKDDTASDMLVIKGNNGSQVDTQIIEQTPVITNPPSSMLNSTTQSPKPMTSPPTNPPTTKSPTKSPTNPPLATSSPAQEASDNDNGDGDVVTVSGSIFWDEDGDGLPNDDNNGATTAGNDDVANNIVVDLYDCADPSTPRWLLLTRTDASGRYQFAVPTASFNNDDDDDADLAQFLERRGVTQFLVVVTLPANPNSAVEYAFSPASRESDVDAMGYTACWDVDEEGGGGGSSIVVWNAGITSVVERPTPTTMAPTERPTPKPTVPSGPMVATASPTGTSGIVDGYGIVGGYAFLDANDDGAWDPDPETELAVGNLEVRLFSCNGGVGGSEPDVLLAVDRTNGRGFYGFFNLFAGSYRVTVQPPPGYKLSSTWSTDGGGGGDDDDADDNADSSVNPETGSTECFRLGDGGGTATVISWNVGLVAAVAVAEPSRSPSSDPVVISGFVFHDVNNNGYLEDGEDGGVFGVQVALFDCSDDGVSLDNIIIVTLTTTDANGMYGFEVDPGSYVVKFSSWEGYQVSDVWSGQMDEEGARQVAPDAENEADPATRSTSCEEYQAGDAVYSLDAGMYLPSSSLEKDEGSSSSDASSSLSSPASRPTQDPKGDGTPCSGVPCLIPGMCRNVYGLCGKGVGFCNSNSVWESNCPPEEEEVSYDNAPFLASLSPGAIVGIVFGILSLIAISAASTILFVRRKREQDEEQFGQQRTLQI